MFLFRDRVGNGGEALCPIEYLMSRQSVAKWRGFVSRQGISCRDRDWSWEEVPMSRPDILGCD